MMAPALRGRFFRRGPEAAWTRVPLSTLALQEDAVLVLDHGDAVVVWSGARAEVDRRRAAGPMPPDAMPRTAAEDAVDEVRRSLRRAPRFPRPRILSVRSGSPEERWLLRWLEPAHRDSLERQTADFPMIASLGAEELRRLRARFPTDAISCAEWASALGVGRA
jgi:hypothetical protein